MREGNHAVDGRTVCQLHVWLRGVVGLVTVRLTDINAYVGIDCAAVRLEQAVIRKLREADEKERGNGQELYAGLTSV